MRCQVHRIKPRRPANASMAYTGFRQRLHAEWCDDMRRFGAVLRTRKRMRFHYRFARLRLIGANDL